MTTSDPDWRRAFEGALGIPAAEGTGIEIAHRLADACVHVQPPGPVASRSSMPSARATSTTN